MQLSFSLRPVAIAFSQQPPPAVAKWAEGPVPAGCVFWRQAMNGRTFYTEPADHYECAVGAHTHGLAVPAELGPRLIDTVGFMVSSGYLQMEEVPGIPVLSAAPAYVSYAPVESAPFAPDVVLFAATPGVLMLLYEAAVGAGAGTALIPTLGRPGCAVLPLTANTGSAALSFGCRGNRTFTGLPDTELYFAIPGTYWDAFSQDLEQRIAADGKMTAHYQQQQALFPILH